LVIERMSYCVNGVKKEDWRRETEDKSAGLGLPRPVGAKF